MNSQQLGQQPIFIWMCYGIFETDLYTETFFCRQKSVSLLTALCITSWPDQLHKSG